MERVHPSKPRRDSVDSDEKMKAFLLALGFSLVGLLLIFLLILKCCERR